jgi:hypothetical protein
VCVMLQAWHTCICGVSPIYSLQILSADPLKLCQVGWEWSLLSYFQVSPEMSDRVQEICLETTPALSWQGTKVPCPVR